MKESIPKQNPTMLESHVVKKTILQLKKIDKTGSQNLKQTSEGVQSTAFASVIKLVEDNDDLNMEELVQHRTTDECLAIFNASVTMSKTLKSKLQENLPMT